MAVNTGIISDAILLGFTAKIYSDASDYLLKGKKRKAKRYRSDFW